MSILALDIGGANLKAADGLGAAASLVFPLWKTPESLAAALIELAGRLPAADRWAVTMTGELADCFRTKAEGIGRILDAVSQAAAGREVLVYGVDAAWRNITSAVAAPHVIAASNWHTLAAYAARFVGGRPAVLLDVGSTTCDLIPIHGGRPAAAGTTDPERLATGELVYTGVVRSPVCALATSLDVRGVTYGVAQELFATTGDAYVMLGELPEDPAERATADGRPATREFARERLARVICADRATFSMEDAAQVARQVAQTQCQLIQAALTRVVARLPEPPQAIVASGQGEFLARAIRQNLVGLPQTIEFVSLRARLGDAVSRCAPAHALAVLRRELK